MRSWLRVGISWLLAVFVSTLLNLMDAVTYGRLLFPTQTPLFARYDFTGVCMYLLCTSGAQLVVALFSGFKRGATACAMVENIPFYHTISLTVANQVFSEESMMATILAAYASTAILTGVLFLGLTLLQLDRLVHKFPRVVLVGSMGGIGLFLIATGLEIATNEAFSFLQPHRLIASWISIGLWGIGLMAAMVALIAELKFGLSFVTPLVSLVLLVGFYLVTFLLPYTMNELRDLGWLLRPPDHSANPLQVFSMFKVEFVDYKVLFEVSPIIVAAALFGAVHVPINVPSFARLTNQPFSMRRELLTQVVSNWVTAIVGFIPNYFVYTNSLLFLRAGGSHRMAGVLLGVTTMLILIYGLELIGIIPTIIVMFLIFYLGLCLMWEAIIGAYIICSGLEYIIILTTMIVMQTFGFISGIMVGIVTAGLLAIYQVGTSRGVVDLEEDNPVQANPAFEGLYKRTLDHCLTVSYGGSLYFGNGIEEIQRLTFTSLESRMLILDFRRVTSIDMNVREGILASLTGMEGAGIFEGQLLVILGLADEPLKKCLNRITTSMRSKMIFADGGPRSWIHEYLKEALLATPTVEVEEETHLLIQSEELPLFLLTDELEQYDNDRTSEERLLMQLRPHSNALLMHRGEPVAAQVPASDGILIILTGQVKRRGRYYGDGAWMGLDVHLQHGEGLSGGQACSSTEALYVPRIELDRLSHTDQLTLKRFAIHIT